MSTPSAPAAGADADEARSAARTGSAGSGPVAGPGSVAGHGTVARTGTWALPALTAAWLGVTLWSAHAAVAGSAGVAVATGAAALALPGLVAATLLAGVVAGLAATRAMIPRGGMGSRRRVVRAGGGLAAGGVVGLCCAGLVLLAYGTSGPFIMIALTVTAAGVLGGAAAALPLTSARGRLAGSVLPAGIGATLAAFGVGVVVNLLQSPLKSLLGAGSTLSSQVLAARGLSYLAGALSGAAAGVVAYVLLRRRVRGQVWPAYLLAGAAPGLLILVTEVLTRVGGATLLRAVRAISPADQVLVDYLASARIVNALVVGFAGGIVAMVAVGRSLGRATDSGDSDDLGLGD